jgi:hypothetical protein
MLHRVKNLPPEQRLAIEALLGRSVSDDEAVSVRAVMPSRLSSDERMAALRELDRYFARVEARRKLVSDEEEDAIFVEAMRSARPNFRRVD